MMPIATQTLVANIYESETGPIVFSNIGTNSIMAYDLDLGENSTFAFYIDSSSNYDIFELKKHLIFDISPNFLNSIQYIHSASNLNIFCVLPFDYHSLNLPSSSNLTLTNTLTKSISFTVSK